MGITITRKIILQLAMSLYIIYTETDRHYSLSILKRQLERASL